MNNRAPHCTATRDPALREAVGAYLLGALDPAESDQVAAHLADCASCREEYGELIELLPLLASVTEGEAVNGPVRPEPAVLGRVLETTSQYGPDRAAPHQHKGVRRSLRRMPRTRIALAISCVVLAAAGSGIGVMMSSSAPTSTTVAAGSWSASASVTPYGWGVPIKASVQVSPASGGSNIQLKMAHVESGYTCTMVVVGTDGLNRVAGSWTAPSNGQITIPGVVSISPDRISSILVNLPNGSTLLSLNHPK